MLTGLEEAKQIIGALVALLAFACLVGIYYSPCEHPCDVCKRKKQLDREKWAETRHEFHAKAHPDNDCRKCRP